MKTAFQPNRILFALLLIALGGSLLLPALAFTGPASPPPLRPDNPAGIVPQVEPEQAIDSKDPDLEVAIARAQVSVLYLSRGTAQQNSLGGNLTISKSGNPERAKEKGCVLPQSSNFVKR